MFLAKILHVGSLVSVVIKALLFEKDATHSLKNSLKT